MFPAVSVSNGVYMTVPKSDCLANLLAQDVQLRKRSEVGGLICLMVQP